MSAELERRISVLENAIERKNRDCAEVFRAYDRRLSKGGETFAEYGIRLDNLWEWKLMQNGVLVEIRQELAEQKKDRQKIHDQWNKVLAGLVVSAVMLILNIVVGRI